MAKLKFNNLADAAAYAQEQDEKIQDLVKAKEALQVSIDELTKGVSALKQSVESAELSIDGFKEVADKVADHDEAFAEFGGLKEKVSQLQSNAGAEELPKGSGPSLLQFEVDGKEYEVKETLSLSLKEGIVSGSDIASNPELAKRLIEAGIKQIKKVLSWI